MCRFGIQLQEALGDSDGASRGGDQVEAGSSRRQFGVEVAGTVRWG